MQTRYAVIVLAALTIAGGCIPDSGGSGVPSYAPFVGEVDPFIGTAGEGQTFPGAAMPNGLATPSPHTRLDALVDVLNASFLEGGFSFAGYRYGDPEIHGFGMTHLSGVGCPELGAPLIVAARDDLPLTFDDYGSAYDNERAFAGYYGVELTDLDVVAEMTAAPRTALLRFRFRGPAQRRILVDAGNVPALSRQQAQLSIVDDRTIEGSAAYGPFCGMGDGGRLYFVVRFDQGARETGMIQDQAVTDAASGQGDAVAYFTFDTAETIEVAVGLSWTSVDGARRNLAAEARPFDDALNAAVSAWQELLGRVEVEGGSAVERRKFYTALYHSLLNPMIASDVDGSYLRFGDNAVVTDATRTHYTVFSLWDTYRTLHPLLTLLYPERQLAMLRAMVDMTHASGRPPKWEFAADEVQMMVGDPALIVFADSYAKGVTDFDPATLLPLLLDGAEDPAHRPGVREYLQHGYIPMELAGGPVGKDSVWGPVATTLEYALADWSLARLATAVGAGARAVTLDTRAVAYRTLFDPETGTLRPKYADGTFLEPYDPDLFIDDLAAGTGGPGFVEGTAWQYAFMVPHDLDALIHLHGERAFVDRLQEVFDRGRFTAYNEPDLAYPYLFTFVDGEAYRTQWQVRRILSRDYTEAPDGLPGNDDTGTLSAWFVFSALGFYPVTPGAAEYRIGSPLFERITLHLTAPFHSGSTFVIDAPGNTDASVYIVEARLNGSPLTAPVLQHADIMRGGTLTLDMSDTPVP